MAREVDDIPIDEAVYTEAEVKRREDAAWAEARRTFKRKEDELIARVARETRELVLAEIRGGNHE